MLTVRITRRHSVPLETGSAPPPGAGVAIGFVGEAADVGGAVGDSPPDPIEPPHGSRGVGRVGSPDPDLPWLDNGHAAAEFIERVGSQDTTDEVQNAFWVLCNRS
jgi:hypothetical protein